MGLVRAASHYGSVYGTRRDWLYCGDPTLKQGSIAVSANRCYYVRRTSPIVPVRLIELYIGIAAGNICVAAYGHNATTGGPGTRLATTGSIACPAAGAQEVNLGTTVLPEWLAIAFDNAVATYHATGGSAINLPGTWGRFAIEVSGFPAPASAGSITFQSGGVPLLIGKP